MATTKRGRSGRRLGLLGMLPAVLLIAAWTAAAQPESTTPPPSAEDAQPASDDAQPTSPTTKPAASPTASPAASPATKPAAKPGASPAAKPGAAAPTVSEPGWNWINNYISLTTLLTGLGVVLAGVGAVGWYRSNRAEARPDAEHLEEMRRFVEEDFARYVAAGLPLDSEGPIPPVSTDEAWRTLFVQRIKLHNELYRFDTNAALGVYTAHVDEAVRRALAARRAAVASAAGDDEPSVTTGGAS